MPPLHNVEDDDSSEPVFRLLLGEEETKAVMKESALETVKYMLCFNMAEAKEINLRIGECVGLCFIVSVRLNGRFNGSKSNR